MRKRDTPIVSLIGSCLRASTGASQPLALTTPYWAAVVPLPGAGMGIHVSCVGDVNDDGFHDVIVGAPDYAPGGRALVFLGGP